MIFHIQSVFLVLISMLVLTSSLFHLLTDSILYPHLRQM